MSTGAPETNGPSGSPDPGSLRHVVLADLPLDVMGRSQEHNEGLLREFALIANPHPDSDQEIPARLVRIVGQLRDQYSGFTAANTAMIEEAKARGDQEITVEYHVPAAAGQAAATYKALLEEADEYCRRGDLLTLAAPPESLALRNWFLGEFMRQINGAEPTPWPAYIAGAGRPGES